MQTCSDLLLCRYPGGEHRQQKNFLASYLGARWQHHMQFYLPLCAKDLRKKKVTALLLVKKCASLSPAALCVRTRSVVDGSVARLPLIRCWKRPDGGVSLPAVRCCGGPCWQGGGADGWGDLQLRWSHRDIKQFVHRCSPVLLDLWEHYGIKSFSPSAVALFDLHASFFCIYFFSK